MRHSFWHIRIPTFAGFLLLIAGVVATSFLVRTGVFFPIRAVPSEDPQRVRISNITDSSFTVSYVTAGQATGSLAYGPTETFGSIALDDRDKSANTSAPHTVHHITVTGLSAETDYRFAIVSEGKTFKEEAESAYTVRTGKTLSESTAEEITFTGSLILPDGTPPEEAIVYLESAEMQVLSFLTGAGGNYTIPAKQARSSDLTAMAVLNDTAVLRLSATSGTVHSAAEVTIAQTTIPPITLSQQYEFTLTEATPVPASEETAPTGSEEDASAFPNFSSNNAVNTNPQILTPQQDETFSDQQPEFAGTAPPGRTVEILIESSHAIKATVRADKSGNWTYRPTSPLEPGTHTISITTRDEAGIARTIFQTFVVNAQGSQFTEPSVSPPTSAPTPTTPPTTAAQPTATRTPTASPSPTSIVPSTTGQPTATTVPTASPTLVPSPTVLIATPVITSVPTTQPTQPPMSPPGSEGLVLIIGLTGLAIVAGGMLFLFTHGLF